jgi:hypothetical protein
MHKARVPSTRQARLRRASLTGHHPGKNSQNSQRFMVPPLGDLFP